MNSLQIREQFLHWNGEEIPLRVEFISTNSCSKGNKGGGGGPKWLAEYTCGSTTFGEAWKRRNQSKIKPKSFHGDFSGDFSIDSNYDSLARSIRDGTQTALSYTIVRWGMDRGSVDGEEGFRDGRHLVISAPPSNAVGRQAPKDLTEMFERYLCHRGTRMADAYCTTLGMNPRWSVRRVLDSEIFEYNRGPRSMRNIPVSEIDDSVIEAFSECTHIHLFDDHIVYGGTMRAMLCSVVEIISQIGMLAEPPVISVTSWHSITASSKVRRKGSYYRNDLIIPQDRISGKQKSANRRSRDTEDFTLLGRLQESDSEFSRSPSIRGLMGSGNCVGPTPPVPRMRFFQFSFDLVRSIGHLFEGSDKMDYEPIEVGGEALDWLD